VQEVTINERGVSGEMLDGGTPFQRAAKATAICSTHMAVGPFLMVLNKEILDKVVSTGKSGKAPKAALPNSAAARQWQIPMRRTMHCQLLTREPPNPFP